MYRIAAVSYLNTLPFLYGLEKFPKLEGKVSLELEYPSLIAEKLLAGQVDIGLVPIVVLKDNPQLNYVVPWGIVADGPVASVKLFSNRPLSEIDHIFLDYQSRTSVNLVKVLSRFYWGISPQWQNGAEGFEQRIINGQAGVVIGDRALRLLGKTKYEYDLAEEWKKFTGLPFVFAAWVSNKHTDREFITVFEQALNMGVSNIDKVVEYYSERTDKIRPYFDPKYYLTQCIKYNLSTLAHKSIVQFFDFLEQL